MGESCHFFFFLVLSLSILFFLQAECSYWEYSSIFFKNPPGEKTVCFKWTWKLFIRPTGGAIWRTWNTKDDFPFWFILYIIIDTINTLTKCKTKKDFLMNYIKKMIFQSYSFCCFVSLKIPKSNLDWKCL